LISLKLINVTTSQIISVAQQGGLDEYRIAANVFVIPGTYILLLETPKETQTLKVVIL
jgi:curli biogenesis system outer membrane secretion channel CsgG